jgi:beta-glucosidase
MDRREDAESREGLLLKSFEDPIRQSIDSLDGSELLEQDPQQHGSRAPAQAFRIDSSFSRLRRKFARRSKCLIITLLVIITSWSLLLASGYWLYTFAPPNGQSPPWYPAPLGGSLSTWAESYAKAAKLVEKMTLPEKVNVTTGTGQSLRVKISAWDNEC